MKLNLQSIKHLQHDGKLLLEFNKKHDKTIISDCFQQPPLKASRELYLNSSDSEEATVYLMQSSGGLVEGDCNEYEIFLRENTRVCLTPQSANLIYPSYNNICSKILINIKIAENAYLEWKPESLIPFNDSKFEGITRVYMNSRSTLLFGDIIAPGRIKRNEIFKYSDFKSDFQVWINEECLVYDKLILSPSTIDVAQLGVLEKHTYIGSLWFISPDAEYVDMHYLNDTLSESNNIYSGASCIDKKVVNVRWLASDIVMLKEEMNKVWELFTTKTIIKNGK